MGEIESQRLERVVLQKHLSAKLAFATSFPSLSPSRNCPTISATLASALFLLWHLYFCIKSRGSFEFNFIFLFGNLLGTGGNWWFIIFRHLQSFPHEHKQLMWSVCLCFFWFGRYFSLYSSIYLPPHPTPTLPFSLFQNDYAETIFKSKQALLRLASKSCVEEGETLKYSLQSGGVVQ